MANPTPPKGKRATIWVAAAAAGVALGYIMLSRKSGPRLKADTGGATSNVTVPQVTNALGEPTYSQGLTPPAVPDVIFTGPNQAGLGGDPNTMATLGGAPALASSADIGGSGGLPSLSSLDLSQLSAPVATPPAPTVQLNVAYNIGAHPQATAPKRAPAFHVAKGITVHGTPRPGARASKGARQGYLGPGGGWHPFPTTTHKASRAPAVHRARGHKGLGNVGAIANLPSLGG